MEWIKIDIFLSKGVIVSPWVFCILLLMAAVGYFLVHKIVNKKWGYTLKREKELEEGNMETAIKRKSNPHDLQ